ncbi:MAG: hypothetical protein HYX25_02230 [Candidatus Solibacter usitatus]|nr:hypothetical protein [Candidatus Solibacter usitatus]
MKQTKLVSAALTAALLIYPAGAARRDAIFDTIASSLAELSQITGLRLRKPVPHQLISREQVHQFLKDRVKEATPEDIRIEELTLKKFGFVPKDFDLAKTTVDLLTEQAAAFYDYHKKKLYITDWTSPDLREAALTHELAHAVADQNFNLGRFLKQASKNDDGSLARMAVMEGQATWLMAESMARRAGGSLKSSAEAAERASRAMDGGGDFPVFDASPLYLRRTLVFPYTDGMMFQDAVLRKLGDAAFTEVFRHPPADTQQVLHPQKYFARTPPRAPLLAKFAARGYKLVAEGDVGELDHAILLTQYRSELEAADLAPHWTGGAYAIYENRRDRRAVLAYSSEWDDSASARRYFAAYEQVLAKKWARMEVRARSEEMIAGSSEDGYFVVRLRDTVVSALEGLPEAVAAP